MSKKRYKNEVRTPSAVFQKVIAQARTEVLLDAAKATQFEHAVIRGDERAAGVRRFLADHLPSAFQLAKGEVVDFSDHRTGQLDLFIFDKVGCSPLSIQSENVLIPCESLYVVIEVKSVLSAKELNTCFAAAKKVRLLRPFEKQFVSARKGGVGADDGAARCLYIIFAYSTNLGVYDWMEKEYERTCNASTESGVSNDVIDLIVVLDRGLIIPGRGFGKEIGDDPMEIFMEFYLHVINFLNREYRRRPVIDWQAYGSGGKRKWVRLGRRNGSDINV